MRQNTLLILAGLLCACGVQLNTFSPVVGTVGANMNVSPATGTLPQTCTIVPTIPAGLTLGSDCTISGIPTAASTTATYTLQATSGQQIVKASVQITINPGIIYTTDSVVSSVSAPVSATPTATGLTLTGCTIAPPLPAGLSINQQCVVAGTATQPSAGAIYTVTATTSTNQTVSTEIGIEID